jgi:hypothetical protein
MEDILDSVYELEGWRGPNRDNRVWNPGDPSSILSTLVWNENWSTGFRPYFRQMEHGHDRLVHSLAENVKYWRDYQAHGGQLSELDVFCFLDSARRILLAFDLPDCAADIHDMLVESLPELAATLGNGESTAVIRSKILAATSNQHPDHTAAVSKVVQLFLQAVRVSDQLEPVDNAIAGLLVQKALSQVANHEEGTFASVQVLVKSNGDATSVYATEVQHDGKLYVVLHTPSMTSCPVTNGVTASDSVTVQKLLNGFADRVRHGAPDLGVLVSYNLYINKSGVSRAFTLYHPTMHPAPMKFLADAVVARLLNRFRGIELLWEEDLAFRERLAFANQVFAREIQATIDCLTCRNPENPDEIFEFTIHEGSPKFVMARTRAKTYSRAERIMVIPEGQADRVSDSVKRDLDDFGLEIRKHHLKVQGGRLVEI